MIFNQISTSLPESRQHFVILVTTPTATTPSYLSPLRGKNNARLPCSFRPICYGAIDWTFTKDLDRSFFLFCSCETPNNSGRRSVSPRGNADGDEEPEVVLTATCTGHGRTKGPLFDSRTSRLLRLTIVMLRFSGTPRKAVPMSTRTGSTYTCAARDMERWGDIFLFYGSLAESTEKLSRPPGSKASLPKRFTSPKLSTIDHSTI